MPNHISHRVFFRDPANIDEGDLDEPIKTLQTLMKTDLGKFDFNVLVPYPAEWAAADDAHDKAMDEALKSEAKINFKDLPKDGYNNGGYRWCIDNWGTKWNAYEVVYDYDCVYLQTAWSTPGPIWIELSKHFPNLVLIVEYADEDRGSNCGVLAYVNGELKGSATDKAGLRDPDLFARAILAEQRKEGYYQDAKRLFGCHIVCLCGSTRFSEAYQKANLEETLKGNIVLTIGCDMRTDAALFADMTEMERERVKERLDWLHLKKISLADEILVLNVGGYIGESTKKEIEHAEKNEKAIRYLEPIVAALPAPADSA